MFVVGILPLASASGNDPRGVSGDGGCESGATTSIAIYEGDLMHAAVFQSGLIITSDIAISYASLGSPTSSVTMRRMPNP
jgi:hypothetical protein